MEKKPKLILILSEKEVRERTKPDGFACPEEYPRHDGNGYYYVIYTHIARPEPFIPVEAFFGLVKKKFACIHDVDYFVEGVTDDRGRSVLRLNVQFNRPMKGGALQARLRVFASCLEQAGIFKNVELCSVVHRKAA